MIRDNLNGFLRFHRPDNTFKVMLSGAKTHDPWICNQRLVNICNLTTKKQLFLSEVGFTTPF